MEMTLGQIAALVDGETEGDKETVIRAVSSAAAGRPDTLAFAESEAALRAALDSAVGAVLVARDSPATGEKPVVRVDDPRLAFVRIARTLHPEARPEPGRHPRAEVHPSARLGDGVSVGPFAVIEAGAEVGERTILGPGVHVGPGVRIGPECRLHAHVVLYPGTTLGARVIVHAGAVLGSDGFGYVDTADGKEKFPQIGTLRIGDDVEIGANATIDRGALDATVVGAGTKIDNLVQIAHNVEIGELCAISALTGIAGTSKIGDRVVFGGQSGMGDHATIGARAILAARAGVLSGKELPGGAVYWGLPARPIRAAKRQLAAMGRIGRLAERVRRLQARIEELTG